VQEVDDRGGECLRLVVGDENTRHAVLNHLRNPADIGRDDRTRQRHRLEDREALGLAVRRQHGNVEGRGDGRDVVPTAGEHDAVGDPVRGGTVLEHVAHRALAHDEQVGVGHAAQHVRPGIDQRLVALLRLEAGDNADDPRPRLHPVLLTQVRRRQLVVVPAEVDAVVDQLDRREARPLVGDLRHDRVRHRDQLVHLGRQAAQRLAIVGRPDPRRVGGRHEEGPGMAGPRHREHRLRPDHVGAVHVGVDDVRPDAGQIRGQRGDRGRVVGLVDERDGEPGPLQLAHGAAGRQGDDARVEPRRIEPAHQPEHVLLGAAVRAGREDLDDADPVAPGGALAVDRGQAWIPAPGHRHQARPTETSRRTSRRWIGSSTAPHSYL
jgi:hypothetical protein